MQYSLRRFAVSFLLLSLAATRAGAEEKISGIVVGWDRHDGRVLLEELNCTGCHRSDDPQRHAKQPPVLTGVGERITPQYLQAFLANPQGVKPGSPMPDVLHALDAGARKEAVDALVHFLVSQGGPMDQQGGGASLFQIERGEALFHTVGCVACHEPVAAAPKHESLGPPVVDPEDVKELNLPKPPPKLPSVPLGGLAMKTTVDRLAAFLLDPLHTRPAGRMPALRLNPGEANMLAAYLLREQIVEGKSGWGVGLDYAYYEGNWNKVPDFDKLTPKLEGSTKGFELDGIKRADGKPLNSNFAIRYHGGIQIAEDGEYTFWTKSDDGTILSIDGKQVVNNDGMHPPQEKQGKIQLTKGRHAIELGFGQGGGGFELSVFWQPPGAKKREPVPPGVLLHSANALVPKGIVEFKVDAQKAARGKELFGTLGCAACHQLGNDPLKPLTAPALAALNPAKGGGCLSDKVAQGRPQFAFDAAQRDALQKAVAAAKEPQSLEPAALALHTMKSFRCLACHRRGEVGGPDEVRAPYFTMEKLVDLGEEGRIPPPLDDAGAKVSKSGFEAYLVNGPRYRTYMATRMPLFGPKNIGHLPELLAQADKGMVPDYKPEFSPRLIDDGRRLIGKKGLGCINCHAWGPYKLQGAEGMDFTQAPKRLTPEWFHAFLTNPQKLRKGTRMPTAWPNGKSFFPEIQGGDVDRQIDAVWAYLSVGEKGGIPAGLSPDDQYLLTPGDEPIVFRTFLNDVGAHAVAVGFRQRTHFAFDGLKARMGVAWSGTFLSAKPAWEGRAGQYTSLPSADKVDFPDGPQFAVLDSESSPWPQVDEKVKAAPPGYRFRGYRYDEKRVPTFLYRFGDVNVEETGSTEYRQAGAYLHRHLVLTSDKPVDKLWFRVATGKQIVEEGGEFVIDDRLHVKVSGGPGRIRDGQGGKELLVPINFQAAAGKQQAVIDLDLTW